jgi:hypothetical protein
VRPTPDGCPADAGEIAEAYAVDRLGGEDLAKFEEHLLVCLKCLAAAEAADGYVRAMKTASGTCGPN